ncbi:aromatic/alkene monooxygenase hydroxylase subunit beta [Ensifer sp. LCM 4579]|uniref:aromatic/alkene monooxygenase hydroxylase subunit beta n=1 Tax=Ensifer sp. LCM 4579 TaxID=1848292 RepID=UPI0008D918A6|nr:aromatic/alkene monooxygenase hydroxylase subunit beta [Ensifer sp. LCM 4579]OHV72686.1 toluene hydroxylase [Ensifer sp. LCM 4579]
MPAISSSVGSGAAGAAIFADSDSRKYRYYEPRGQRATHYEDVTVDVQPDPERYLLQNWIINFSNGKGAYVKDNTAALSSNWHAFRAPDQEWERTHYQRQSKIETMVQSVIANGRKSGAPKAFDKVWLKILQTHLGAWKHAEFGLGTSLMQAQRYGYTQMINNATLTNSSYKLRLAQDITLYLAEIGMDIPGWDDTLGKQAWLEDRIWQSTREAIETIMGSADYLEQYFAINIVFEPLVGELFRSGFLMQAAAANHDFITPPVISAAEADYERNLANTIDLIYLLAHDEEHGAHNRQLFRGWLSKHRALAGKAALDLQPIWSMPHSKPVSFDDVRAQSEERIGKILGELGLDG